MDPFSIVARVIGAFAFPLLGALVYAGWEHRPDGWPNIAVNTPIPFVHFHLGFGDGPFGEVARARIIDPTTMMPWWIEATQRGIDLKTCNANQSVLTASLSRQNLAVAALKDAGDRMSLAATKAASDALRASAGLNAKAAALLAAKPAGADRCARAESAFEAVKASVRP